ncbi:MAG: hypothetical protein WDZ84_11775 [Rhodovibrionaceae bacterium]
MRSVILAGAAAVFLLSPAGSALGEDKTPERDFEEQARQGLESLMLALESFIQAIPQYEMPEILDNGDIIIRRVHPGDSPESPEEEDSKQI